MAGSSKSPVSEPIQRYAKLSSGTCCLLMTQQLQPIPRRNSSQWWTASHRPVRTSNLPSVWRRRMSWDRTQKHRWSLPSTTTNSMMSAAVCHAAYPGSTITDITDNLSLDAEIDKRIGSFNPYSSHGSSVDTTQAVYTWRHRWRSMMRVLPAHCCMTAIHVYAGQERMLNIFHDMRNIRRIMGIYL